MTVLVTGGIGYIGSHTLVELLNNNTDVIVVDNLINSSKNVIGKVEKITGKSFKFYEVDLLDKEKLDKIFEENKIDSVIHFAGLKAVGESVKIPLRYYDNNITGTLNLLETMQKYNCKKIIFSSSATVYGDQKDPEFIETMSRGKTTNPYGSTKSMIEQILEDLYISDNEWKITILRYFNPIGAHESGIIGDNPNGIPNNLMPYVQKVAVGELKEVEVFGNDYPTPDGTGIRDFIHVVDLAKGHVKALDRIETLEAGSIDIYNLGTGTGYSVLDIINTFERVNNVKVPYKIVARRSGDLAQMYSNASKAEKELGWKATKNLEDMCRDSWNFAKNNMN